MDNFMDSEKLVLLEVFLRPDQNCGVNIYPLDTMHFHKFLAYCLATATKVGASFAYKTNTGMNDEQMEAAIIAEYLKLLKEMADKKVQIGE